MTMTFAEIVKLGLAKEKNAQEFYRHWANRLEGPDSLWPRAKVLLLSLAAEEGKHQEIFDKLKATDLQPNGRAENFKLEVEEQPAAEEMPSAAGTKEVIRVAMEREDRAIRFYSDLAKLGGNMRGVFGQLAKQERAHKQRLEEFCQQHILTWD